MSEIIKKKRGRKPKNFNTIKPDLNIINEVNINSDEEKVIFHLPITMTDIINHDTSVDMSLFIKSDKDQINTQKSKITDDSEINTIIQPSINTINKITTHALAFTKNTKCWWCKNIFDSPAVQLPEDYYNETFYCIGYFCGFSCAKTYNIDLNDTLTSKRESLLNLLYYLTYGEYKEINLAPHWLTLDEYGGTLSIVKFRENSVVNTKEYLVLHPPLISRQMQIEESYRKHTLKEVPIDKVNKIYSEIDSEYTIKRNKPIQSSQLNLETTMGLVKIKKR